MFNWQILTGSFEQNFFAMQTNKKQRYIYIDEDYLKIVLYKFALEKRRQNVIFSGGGGAKEDC